MVQMVIEAAASIIVGIFGVTDSILNFNKYSKSENLITRLNNILQPIFSILLVLLGIYILFTIVR